MKEPRDTCRADALGEPPRGLCMLGSGVLPSLATQGHGEIGVEQGPRADRGGLAREGFLQWYESRLAERNKRVPLPAPEIDQLDRDRAAGQEIGPCGCRRA